MMAVEELQIGMIAFIGDDRPPGIINAIHKVKGKSLLSFRTVSNYGEFWSYDRAPHEKVEVYTVAGFLRQFHPKPRTLLK